MIRNFSSKLASRHRRLASKRRQSSNPLRRFESLETRNLLATLLAGLDTSGNFLVTDSAGAEDDSVTLYRDGTDIVAFSEAGIDPNGVNQTADDANSVRVPAAAITGRIIVDLQGGANQLEVSWDFQEAAGGDPTVAGGVTYTVINDADDDDSLTVAYAGPSPVTVNYAETTSNAYGGSVRVGGSNGPVNFSNIDNTEAAELTLAGASNVILNLPGRGDRGVLGIDSTTGGVSLASSVANAPTFAETIIETDATVAITVNMGPDSGLFVVEEVRDGGDTITINGQAGNDTITVGLPDSPINAELALNGGDGNDTIIGSDGAEVISGGNGDDSLSGGGGDDTLLGGEGRDRLMGGAGDDELSGGGGDDTLFGDTGEAIPLAEGGDDTLNGGLGVDILNGETGADRVNGNEGNDILRIQGSAAVDDTLDGGAGADVLELIGDVLVPVVLGEFGGASTKTVSLERIVAGGRVLAGTDVDNRFDFSKITFVSLAAIHGLGGNDTIIGSLGSDLIYGHSPDSTSTDSDDDTLRGSGGNDTLFGGPGDDVLKGGLGNDLLNGGVGEDNIDGELGNDTLQARQDEAEFDTLQGGGGIDSLVNLDTEALVLNGFDGKTYGIESIRGNGQAIVGNDDANTFDFRFVGTAAVTLTSVTEIRGGAGDDTIYGGAATDSIFGDDGMDELFGGAGNDALFGGDGDDIIKGDGGVDTIDGGVGADLLYGGDGNDIFVFNSGDNDDLAIDKVMDYRNDLLRYVGYASTGFSSGYAAIRSESIDGGVRVVQNVSGKKVDLRGPLRVKPVASRFVFVTGTP